MIRVHPSSLDGFQYYLESNLSTKDFIFRLCRMDKKSDWAHAGNALHKYIEHGGKVNPVVLQDGRSWSIVSQMGKNIEIPRPQISEFRIEKPMNIHGHDVMISGIVDGLVGNRLLEWKGVKRMNLIRFSESWQWRCYLATDARLKRVDYHVFLMSIKGRQLCIREHRRLVVQEYKNMENELYSFIGRYVDHLLQLEDQGLIKREKTSLTRYRWILGDEFVSWNKLIENEK